MLMLNLTAPSTFPKHLRTPTTFPPSISGWTRQHIQDLYIDIILYSSDLNNIWDFNPDPSNRNPTPCWRQIQLYWRLTLNQLHIETLNQTLTQLHFGD